MEKSGSPNTVLVYPKGKIITSYQYDFYYTVIESVGGPLKFTIQPSFPVSFNDKSAIAERKAKADLEAIAARKSLYALADREQYTLDKVANTGRKIH